MKNLLITIVMLATTSAFADSMTGDKIHFQKESTWVNSYYSKSICFDGTDFHAQVSTCVKWVNRRGGQECAKYGKKAAVQPQVSLRKRCVESRGRDGECTKWEMVRYFQDDVRTIKFFRGDRDHRPYKTIEYQIPSC
jgi:hypothetical protein